MNEHISRFRCVCIYKVEVKVNDSVNTHNAELQRKSSPENQSNICIHPMYHKYQHYNCYNNYTSLDFELCLLTSKINLYLCSWSTFVTSSDDVIGVKMQSND